MNPSDWRPTHASTRVETLAQRPQSHAGDVCTLRCDSLLRKRCRSPSLFSAPIEETGGDPGSTIAVQIIRNLRQLSEPAHKGAHEYMGEAFLMKNDLTGAQKQLAELERICQKNCDEYRDLAQAIDDYKEKKPIASKW